MSVELCLFRHGRTTWNAEGRYQGHADVELDDLGHGQALAVAQRCRQIAPMALYSSDLVRCRVVGEAISDATGAALRLDDRLRERDVGAWSGLTRAEIAERFPDEWEAWRLGDEVRPGGGETLDEVVARTKAFVETIRSRYDDGSVVAVTHGGWIRTLVQWVLGDGVRRSSFGVPSQGALTVFQLADDGSCTLEAFNDRGHLLSVEPIDQEPPAPPVF
jgi:glucosyl-3-phosphoglycerate phosphatase